MARILTASNKKEGTCYEWLWWINGQSAALSSWTQSYMKKLNRQFTKLSASNSSNLRRSSKSFWIRHTATLSDCLGRRHWYHKVCKGFLPNFHISTLFALYHHMELTCKDLLGQLLSRSRRHSQQTGIPSRLPSMLGMNARYPKYQCVCVCVFVLCKAIFANCFEALPPSFQSWSWKGCSSAEGWSYNTCATRMHRLRTVPAQSCWCSKCCWHSAAPSLGDLGVTAFDLSDAKGTNCVPIASYSQRDAKGCIETCSAPCDCGVCTPWLPCWHCCGQAWPDALAILSVQTEIVHQGLYWKRCMCGAGLACRIRRSSCQCPRSHCGRCWRNAQQPQKLLEIRWTMHEPIRGLQPTVRSIRPTSLGWAAWK